MIPERLMRALKDPVYLGYQLRSRYFHAGLMRRYGELARAQSCNALYLVLSFDCDTAEDIDVVGELHQRLVDIGVAPVYAVPGQLLEKGELVYRRIHESGGEFISHGYVEHTYFDHAKGRHASCFFYDQVGPEAVAQDVSAADKCLRDVLGIRPQGFRTPHFGTYQQPAQLEYLHGLLRQLSYAFSTSTTPYHAFRYGPLAPADGLVEIPVSGMGSAPLTILDSWACFAAPDRTMTSTDYLREAAGAGRNYRQAGSGILNYYADPSHIHDQAEFIRAVESWLTIAEPVNYRSLLEKTNVI
ncbi:MAG: polysaccharide deacetylase family protein [Proteobacteria bacterium]|nr:polysaccharide deacetylase family protein [Pseudomonadota bacterium]